MWGRSTCEYKKEFGAKTGTEMKCVRGRRNRAGGMKKTKQNKTWGMEGGENGQKCIEEEKLNFVSLSPPRFIGWGPVN